MYRVMREADGDRQVIGYADDPVEMVSIIEADRKATKDDAFYYAVEEAEE